MDETMKNRQVQGREIALVGLFAALTAVGAVVSFQVTAVPFTLQLMFTLLAGAVLGSRLGSLSQVSYLLMGLAGLPVFSMRRAGFGVLFGPTGGFLIGFILGAWVTGKIVEWAKARRGKATPWVALLAMVAGAVTTYVPGIAWLAWHVDGLKPAVVSMIPFIPVDLGKAVLGAGLYSVLVARGIGVNAVPASKM